MQPEAAPPRPLVMADVAARAGVSHQTVSRVINGHPSVAPHHAGAGAAGDRRARLPAEPGRAGAGHRVDPHDRPGHREDQPVRPGADDARSGARRPGRRLLAERLDPGRRHGRGDARGGRPLRRPVGRRRVALSTYDDAAEALRLARRARCRWSRSRWAAARTGRPSAWTRRPARGWPPGTCWRWGTARCTTSPGRRLAGGARPHRPAGAPSWSPPVRRCPSCCGATGRRPRATPPAGSWPPGSAPARHHRRVPGQRPDGPGLLAALHEEGLAIPGTSASSASTTCPRRRTSPRR